VTILRRDFGEVLWVSPAPPARGARGRAEHDAGVRALERRRRDLGPDLSHVLDERLRRLGVDSGSRRIGL
jgi:hypothetical protein